MTVYAAIGGLIAMLGGFVYYASLDNPHLELAEIKLQSIEILDVNTIENSAKLEVTFLIKNPSEKTFTVPSISYELFVDGEPIGNGQYSTQDIPMPGRAAFYPGAEIPLKNTFHLILSEVSSDKYKAIVSGEDLIFSASGVMDVETAWSIIEKEFQISM